MQSPTAVPRIPASASGVSTQRSGPKRSSSPAVARKTPPARPTSSPITITSSSRSSSTWKQSLIASTSVSSATKDPSQLTQLLGVLRQRIGVRVLEQERDIGRRLGLRLGDPLPHHVGRLGADLLRHCLVEHAEPFQVALVPPDALVLLLLLDALEIDVRPRIVRRSVRGRAIGHRLDEARTFA